ncbi:hypothetical protein AGMMS50256_34310 [Betaproteobacteria bacterium]|nr:hypothetical protein AGMMS50256_34310 [Betaproteobacteria bacterium]
MSNHFIYVFDASRHRDLFPETMDDIKAVRWAIDQLSGKEDGPNPKFQQLGKYFSRADVLQHLPIFDPGKGDAQEFFWLNNPEQELHELTSAVWMPSFHDWNQVDVFMGMLLLLSRHLDLDVCDYEIGVYIPARSMPVPREEGSRYRLSLDQGAAEDPRLALPMPAEQTEESPSDEQGPVLQDWIAACDDNGESKQYPLYVFAPGNHQDDIFPHLKNRNLKGVEQAVEQLRHKELKKNPRFKRLGRVLARRLPVAGDDSLWLTDPENELASCTTAAWQPKLKDSRRIGELLKVLMPLVRELQLDMFDAFQRIHLPGCDDYWSRYPLPDHRGHEFRQTYDPAASTVKQPVCFTKKGRFNLFEKRLTEALGAHGFKRDINPRNATSLTNIEFTRRSDPNAESAPENTGEQRISVDLDRAFFDCSILLKSHSKRMLGLCRDWSQKYQEKFSHILGGRTLFMTLWDVQKIVYPVWRCNKVGLKILTGEDADWVVEDLIRYGIPILDRIRTVDGVDWFYNRNPDTAYFFRNPHMFDKDFNLKREFDYSGVYFSTVYARLAGNPDFDEIVRDFEQRIEALPEDFEGFWGQTKQWHREKYALIVNLCRTELQAVSGDEIA